MRILLVSHTADLNGAELSLLDIARCLTEKQIDCIVMCPNFGPLVVALKKHGVEVRILSMQRPQRSIPRLLLFIVLWLPTVLRLSLWLKRQHVSLVYNNTIDGIYAPFAAKLSRVPCVWHVREVKPRSRQGRWLFAKLLKTLSVVGIFNSGATMYSYASSPPAHWRIIYNGIAVEQFNSSGNRLRQAKLVGYVGQMAGLKRPVLFLEILSRVRTTIPEVRGIMVGDGPLLEEIRMTVARLGISDAIEICGHVDEPSSVYQSISVFVLTSERESFGRVIVEAMAAGCAVVAADVGGVKEIIAHGVDGFLVPSDDIEQFVEKVVLLLENSAVRDAFSEAGSRKAQQQFTVERYCEQVIDVLRAVDRGYPIC